MKKSILIVGGSISGLSAALVLASAKNAELDFDISIVDDGKADLAAAAIYNVPLFPKAIVGKDIIEGTKKQIDALISVKYINATVAEISGSKGAFVATGDGVSVNADYIVLATGASRFDIKGLGDIVRAHELMNKPGKIRLATTGRQLVKDGIYAAGLASGVTTMVSCAIGSGAEAACAILSDIKGEIAIVHDTPTTRK